MYSNSCADAAQHPPAKRSGVNNNTCSRATLAPAPHLPPRHTCPRATPAPRHTCPRATPQG
eukprot:365658-Chlamydomonas_euryale.AAC.1